MNELERNGKLDPKFKNGTMPGNDRVHTFLERHDRLISQRPIKPNGNITIWFDWCETKSTGRQKPNDRGQFGVPFFGSSFKTVCVNIEFA